LNVTAVLYLFHYSPFDLLNIVLLAVSEPPQNLSLFPIISVLTVFGF